jgi:tetratricopeptide (TPR) repeat protein
MGLQTSRLQTPDFFMRTVSHYCQKCLAANPLGQELCGRCGTRLMLVVEPPAARYEEGGLVATHEEHLLERVSALENRLMRLTDKLEQTLDLLLRQAKNAYFDHALVDTLITVLHEAGSLDAAKLNKLWRERCKQDDEAQEEKVRRERLRKQILLTYRGAEQLVFEQCINEGFRLLGEKETDGGIRALERAAAMASGNAALHSLIGEHFFQGGQNTLARDYLERALKADAKNERVRLLLGLTYGDIGEVERARELLKDSLRQKGESFAARYGLGRLFIAEQKWNEALKEFKSALAARPSPEAHYAVGCVYFRHGRDRMAARHLRKAVEMAEDYTAAYYVLGLVLLRQGEAEQARAAFNAATEGDSDEAHYRSASRRMLRSGEMPTAPRLFGMNEIAKKGLITGGDRRLAQALRQAALGEAEVEGGSN